MRVLVAVAQSNNKKAVLARYINQLWLMHVEPLYPAAVSAPVAPDYSVLRAPASRGPPSPVQWRRVVPFPFQ